MKDLMKIAWRNLWRNRKRTLITTSSILFAVFFAILMNSFMKGTIGNLMTQSIESYTGYLQVQQIDFFEDPLLDNAMTFSQEQLKQVRSNENVSSAVPRINSGCLASTGKMSKGVAICGIDPESEAGMTQLETRIVEGDYLTEHDKGVLVSRRLSSYLQVAVGDSVILLGQAYHGVSAAGIYPVRGIVEMQSPTLDNKLIYMTIPSAQYLFDLPDMLTSVAINLHQPDDLSATKEEITALFEGTDIAVKSWSEIDPSIEEMSLTSQKTMNVFVFVLYLIIFFGIYGTMQMMISERQKEFGILLAIGMPRSSLAKVFSLEMAFLALLGVLFGMLVATPIMLYFHYFPIHITGDLGYTMEKMGFEPVMPFALFGAYYYEQAIIVFAMVSAAALQPVRHLMKLTVINALHK